MVSIWLNWRFQSEAIMYKLLVFFFILHRLSSLLSSYKIDIFIDRSLKYVYFEFQIIIVIKQVEMKWNLTLSVKHNAIVARCWTSSSRRWEEPMAYCGATYFWRPWRICSLHTSHIHCRRSSSTPSATPGSPDRGGDGRQKSRRMRPSWGRGGGELQRWWCRDPGGGGVCQTCCCRDNSRASPTSSDRSSSGSSWWGGVWGH